MQMQSDFPKTGFVREVSIVAPDGVLPINRSTLWRWVRDGHFPAPVKIGPNTTAWRAEAVIEFMARAEQAGSGEAHHVKKIS